MPPGHFLSVARPRPKGPSLSQQTEFYLARAAEQRHLSDGSTLANVRDGHLRAAAAWDALASRALKADRMRVAEEQRKASMVAD